MPISSGYTPEQREGRLKALLKQRNQIDKQIEAGLGVSPLPEEPPEPDDDVPGTFASDLQYCAAVVEYERSAGRYAETKDAKHPATISTASTDRSRIPNDSSCAESK